jgi:RND family efflux transporter MFP subunit
MLRIWSSLLLACGAVLLAACSEQIEQAEVVRPVRAIKVGDATGMEGRSFPGRARAAQEVDLSFRVAGPLIELPNDIVGREYRQGDVVARLDPRDYEVKVRELEAKLDRAKSSVKRAEGEYERELNIFQQDAGATSKTAVDRKRDARDQAIAEVKSLQASLYAAKDDLEYTHLKAPFDGRVVAKYVENFQDVRAKQQVVRLLDTSQVKIVVDIPENLISKLPYVEDIRVVYDAFPGHSIPARIHEVGTEASFTTRTYPVTLIHDQPEAVTILAGMAGRASGRVKEPKEVAEQPISVPVGAVFTPETEEQNYVWVIDEGTGQVARRPVTTGALVPTGIEIAQGLEAGAWIAVAGVHSLHEGQRVRIVQNGGQ